MTFDRRQAVILESVRRFLRRSAPGHLVKLMSKIRPADFPPIYERLIERERLQIFRTLADRDPERGAQFLVELPTGEGPVVLRALEARQAAALLDLCADDDAAELLAGLEDDEAQAILKAMEPEEKRAVEQLLSYEEETAGRIMTPDVMSLSEDTTVEDAISALQTGADVEVAFYLYVVDARQHLVGVLSLRELLLHPPGTRLGQFMNTDLITVRADADQEVAAQMAAKYDLLGLPVVDDQGRLVGMVTIDDVVDVLRQEATEDIFKMAGTSEEERIEPSILKSARIRSPWLLATFLGGVVASFVIGSHDESLSAIWGLAAFLPIVLGMGGSAGNQSATVIIRGLATGRIQEGAFARTFWREVGVAGLLGILYGVLVGFFCYGLLLFRGGESATATGLWYPVVIGAALGGSMLLATTVGAMFPLLLARWKIDPAVATTPFVTTATDVLGSLIYVFLISWLLFR
ncbi:MAG: magnesium transporter [bacterium]|nr:magnesium transporter [bacterium]